MKKIIYLFIAMALVSCSDDQESSEDLGKCGTDGVQYKTSLHVAYLKDIVNTYNIDEKDVHLYDMRYRGHQLFKLYKGACISNDCEQELYDLIAQLEEDWSGYDESEQSLKPQYTYMTQFLRDYDNSRCY